MDSDLSFKVFRPMVPTVGTSPVVFMTIPPEDVGLKPFRLQTVFTHGAHSGSPDFINPPSQNGHPNEQGYTASQSGKTFHKQTHLRSGQISSLQAAFVTTGPGPISPRPHLAISVVPQVPGTVGKECASTHIQKR
jgi:hypothetical protein